MRMAPKTRVTTRNQATLGRWDSGTLATLWTGLTVDKADQMNNEHPKKAQGATHLIIYHSIEIEI